MDQVKSEYNYDMKIYFHDLNHDSISELIKLYYDGNTGPEANKYNAPAIIVLTDFSTNKGYNVLEQFNLPNKWFRFQDLSFGDFDGDNAVEIYVYCISQDSLFLMGIDPYQRKTIFLERFITTFNYDRGFPDINPIEQVHLYDLDGDGKKEILGTVNSGYSAGPRFLFSYNIVKDTLVKSSTAYAYVHISDVLGTVNSEPLITTSSFAPGNVDSIQMVIGDRFTDYSSYLIVFDANLQFYFHPVENQGFTSSVMSFLNNEDDDLFLYSLVTKPGGFGPKKLAKQDMSGKVITQRIIDDSIKYALMRIPFKKGSKIFLKDNVNYTVQELNHELKTITVYNPILPDPRYIFPFLMVTGGK